MTLASTQDGSNCIISLYHKIYYSFITINYLSINYVHISTTTTYLLLINYLSTTNLLPINYHSSTYQLPTYLLRNTYLAPNFKRSCITRPILLSVRKYLFCCYRLYSNRHVAMPVENILLWRHMMSLPLPVLALYTSISWATIVTTLAFFSNVLAISY